MSSFWTLVQLCSLYTGLNNQREICHRSQTERRAQVVKAGILSWSFWSALSSHLILLCMGSKHRLHSEWKLSQRIWKSGGKSRLLYEWNGVLASIWILKIQNLLEMFPWSKHATPLSTNIPVQVKSCNLFANLFTVCTNQCSNNFGTSWQLNYFNNKINTELAWSEMYLWKLHEDKWLQYLLCLLRATMSSKRKYSKY